MLYLRGEKTRCVMEKKKSKTRWWAALAVLVVALVLLLAGRVHIEDDEVAPQVLYTEAVDTTALLLMQVQQCSRLYTTEWHIHKIVTHKDDLQLRGQLLGKRFSVDVPAGDRKIAMPIDATVKGYIDMSLVTAGDIQRRGDRITLYLPAPEAVLTSTKIDQRAVKDYVSLTRRRFSDEEMASYARQGRKAILQSIPQLGIEQSARESAARLLVPMFVKMGFKEENITITFSENARLKVLESERRG